MAEMENMRAVTLQFNGEAEGPHVHQCCFVRWFSPLQPGSVRSGSVALAATSLGSGALALPFAFSLTGLGVGMLTMVMAMIMGSLSLQILIVAARYTNSTSYGSMLSLVSKSSALSFALDLAIVLNGVGSVTCILIFQGDFLPSIFGSPPWGTGINMDRRLGVLVAAVAVFPLTLPENISALRYTSVLVPVVLIATILIVWAQVPQHLETIHQTGGSIVWWEFNFKNWLKAVPIMVNAFTNHQNAVPVGNQLDQPSIARIVKTTFNANFMVLCLLTSLGIGGYLSFGANTQGDFISNYEKDSTAIWACRVMLSITIYFVIPVALLPTSKSCAQLVLAVLPGPSRTVSRPLHVLSSTTCFGICMGIAVATDNVAFVIGVLGGLLATSIMFWFPGIIFWIALWPTQPRLLRYLVLAALVFFGICGYASVVSMIWDRS